MISDRGVMDKKSVDAGVPLAELALPRPRAPLLLLVRKPLALSGLVIALSVLVLAAIAPLVVPYGFDEQNLSAVLQGPSWSHWFGTDQLGRDVFSRVLYGCRTSAIIGITSVAIATAVGAVVGVVSAYTLGMVDLLLQRVIDTMSALPSLVLLLSLIVILGNGLSEILLAEAIVFIPSSVRLVRAEALVVRNQPFIEAARALGASPLRVMLRHVMPGVMPLLIVVATVQLGSAILLESSLSYLGYGIQPPTPAWGYMLSGSTQALAIQAPWLAVAPGAAIALTVFGFNVLGDGIRDVLDPRLRGSQGR